MTIFAESPGDRSLERMMVTIPGVDSFRRLTDEEFAEEQKENIDEDIAPVMGM